MVGEVLFIVAIVVLIVAYKLNAEASVGCGLGAGFFALILGGLFGGPPKVVFASVCVIIVVIGGVILENYNKASKEAFIKANESQIQIIMTYVEKAYDCAKRFDWVEPSWMMLRHEDDDLKLCLYFYDESYLPFIVEHYDEMVWEIETYSGDNLSYQFLSKKLYVYVKNSGFHNAYDLKGEVWKRLKARHTDWKISSDGEVRF